jgi:chemotaxis protein methyltransferase CheR
MTAALAQLADVIRRESGIVVDAPKHRSLETAAGRTAPGMDAPQLLRVLDDSRRGPELLRRLIDEVTVNETFFFRHPTDLLALDWRGLLTRARSVGREAIRVWVAACATGEEAYTLAMLASDAFAPGPAPVSIVATDISDAALAAARHGVYGPRAVRGIEPELRKRYMTRDGENLAVTAQLRHMVRFTRHNLVHDPPPAPGSFDLITCRNVLIYFDPGTAGRVAESLRLALSRGGTLMLGAADRISLPIGVQPSLRQRERSSWRTRLSPSRPPSIDASGTILEPGLTDAPPDAASSGVQKALEAANAGRLTAAIEMIGEELALNPLNAQALFVRGLIELGSGDAQAATVSLRRALYARPDFGLAAFKLGRALELTGEDAAAAQAYKQALLIFVREDAVAPSVLGPVASTDVVAACRLRLRVLGDRPGAGREVSGRAVR